MSGWPFSPRQGQVDGFLLAATIAWLILQRKVCSRGHRQPRRSNLTVEEISVSRGHWTYLREAGVSDEDVEGGAVVCIFELVFTLATVLILGGAGVEGDAVEVSAGYKIGALGSVPQVRSLGTANGRGITLEPGEVPVSTSKK
ncbi:hypothetical protein BHE74_00042184 [Ensete ventricosum]|nr:hypothetical protein BHE74_00042184 [Ensete ventricosum]RZR97751.1 hypothetical protein BHM03_00026981 [Ensete ventricosum]